jgi:3-oxoadipyl-CoA thiolase
VNKAVVLAGLRTPIGRYGGALSGVRPDDLAALVIREVVDRSGVPAGEIEDVWFGCANQAGEDNRNVARMAALLAGLPETVAGVTVNRLCASGLTAITGACHAVIAGDGDLFVAGGVESMSRAPFVVAKADKAFPRGNQVLYDTHLGWRFPNPKLEAMFPLESMGETGENVAERYGVTREEQDAFALRSHQRWAAADFGEQIVAVPLPGGGDVTRDEHPRPDTSLEKLAALKPAFRAGGTVTAGNAAGINDGAAALVIASEEKARGLGIEPLATFVGSAAAGVDPRYMGIGPVPAVRKLLDRVGVSIGDIDLVELNEAFAAQSIPVIRELGLDPEIVNVNGGAIALGHPLGMSGARIVVQLLHELNRRGGRYGLATLCVGVGQGQAALFERTTAGTERTAGIYYRYGSVTRDAADSSPSADQTAVDESSRFRGGT